MGRVRQEEWQGESTTRTRRIEEGTSRGRGKRKTTVSESQQSKRQLTVDHKAEERRSSFLMAWLEELVENILVLTTGPSGLVQHTFFASDRKVP